MRSFNQFENECVFCSNDLELEVGPKPRRKKKRKISEDEGKKPFAWWVKLIIFFLVQHVSKTKYYKKTVSHRDWGSFVTVIFFLMFIVIQSNYSQRWRVKIDTREIEENIKSMMKYRLIYAQAFTMMLYNDTKLCSQRNILTNWSGLKFLCAYKFSLWRKEKKKVHLKFQRWRSLVMTQLQTWKDRCG